MNAEDFLDDKPTAEDFLGDEKPKKKTLADDALEGVKGAFGQGMNTLDLGATLAASNLARWFSGKEEQAKMFENLNKRIEERNKEYGPSKDQSFRSKALGMVGTLPLQMLAMPLSPVETGKTFIDQGESAGRTAAAMGLDAALTAAGITLPGAVNIGKTALGRLGARTASGAGINALQDTATRAAIQQIAEQATTRKIFEPSWESAALAAIPGAAIGAFSKGKKPPVKKTEDTPSLKSLVEEQPKVETPAEQPAQKQLTVDQLPENVREQQAIYNREDFVPAKVEPEVDPRQQGLPFDAGPEEIVRNRYEQQQPEQRDMFAEQDIAQQRFDPVQEQLFKDAIDEPVMDVLAREQAVARQQEMDRLFTEREQEAKRIEAQEKALERDESLKLLEDQFGPVRVSKREQRKLNRGMGRRQGGAFDVESISEALANLRKRWGNTPVDSLKEPTSPEMILKKQEYKQKLAVTGDILKEKLPEFSDVTTFEEATTLSARAQDIKTWDLTRATASGLNFMAAYHNNPLLRFARHLVTKARGEATAFSRNFVSGEQGISTALQRLTKEEKVLVNRYLTEMDAEQIAWTPELREKLPVSENVKKYLDAHTRAFDAYWEWRKETADKQGLDIGPKRYGYSPGVFFGAYTSLVTAPNKKGEMSVIGLIAVDTPGEFMRAKEHYQKTNPQAKFSANTWQEARKSFSGGQNAAFKYKNLGQMMELLSSVDGDISKVNIKLAQDALKASVDMFGMNVHDLRKKGVLGNQGNKPWLSPERNAQERLDSVVKFLEDGAEYLALQRTSEELRLIMADPSTDHMPNAKNYLDEYFRNVSGTYVNSVGKIMNAVFDGVHRHLIEAVAAHIPGARDYIGPNNTLKMSNTLKNKMSQWYMGWFNWMFMMSQFGQPIQTALPLSVFAANKINLPHAEAMNGFVKGTALAARVFAYKHGLLDVDDRTKTILKYGENQGILDFTELERAYEGNKGKLHRAYDKTAEWTMQMGELGTRPPVFFSFVEMLSKVEPDLNKVLPVAEHLTNQAMGDYHKWERPLLYNGLGVLAPHAGGLTTFKHNYMGTQALLAKELKGLKSGKVEALTPVAMSLMAMIGFAGITGVPFYDELNTLYEELRERWAGERRSIAQDFLQDIDQHWKTGVVSSILDLNMQGKFSSANMIPDTLGQAAFPHLSGAYSIGKSWADFVSTPNETTMSNALTQSAPSGWRQAANKAWKQDEEGWLLNKRGERDVKRTPEEWFASSITGLVPLQEAIDKTRRFQNQENEKARTAKMKEIAQKFRAAVIANENDQVIGQLLTEYEKYGGMPPNLIRQIPEIQREAQKSSDERLRGIPKTPQAIRRYEAYDN